MKKHWDCLKGNDKMRIIVCENYDEMSRKAADILAAQVLLKPNTVLGLATGSTPLGMYSELVKKCEKGEVDFSQVKSFNLDEYYPIKRENEQSYYRFMHENFFSKININPENTNVPNGEVADAAEECKNYEKKIKESGGVDLQILGIGNNGHIGFNEPDTSLELYTHLTDLTEDTIQANSRFFESCDDVPKKALTMGIATICSAKMIVLLASGKNKARAVAELLEEGISTQMPSTMLKTHRNVIVICDHDAYSEVK